MSLRFRLVRSLLVTAVGVGSFVTEAATQCVADLPHLPEDAVATSQFGAPAAPPPGLTFDDVRGEIVNFETMMAKPILVTNDEQYVIVANEADDRLVVFTPDLQTIVAEVKLGQGICALAERPGVQEDPGDPTEIWVSLRHQAAVAVIETGEWTVKQVLRPPIDPLLAGARFADQPGGIAFNADGSRGFVAASSTDRLICYDMTSMPPQVTVIPLTENHLGLCTDMNEPFCVTSHGDSIYVASYRSGNQTVPEAIVNPAILPPNSQITDLTQVPSRSLPDFDVMVIDAATLSVVQVMRDAGTLLAGMAVIPGADRLVVANQEMQNGKFLGEGAFPDGRVALNRLTYFDLASGAVVQHRLTENLTGAAGSAPWLNVVQPTDIAIDHQDRVLVAGYGSANIGIFRHDGTFVSTLPAEVGPLGLAYATGSKRLYCYNRGSASVRWYDFSTATPAPGPAAVPLPDPTFDDVKQGRMVWLDASHSAKGTTSCNSCHQFLRNDGLAWDLSKYHDDGDGFTLASPPQFWQDRKGVMQTQDLRSIEDTPPYHWRGEQHDLDAFNGAFINLLKGTRLTPEPLRQLEKFVFSAVYPPNPFQSVNRVFSDAAKIGLDAYRTEPTQDGGGTCANCHTLPIGTDDSISVVPILGHPYILGIETAQLRGLWEKTSDVATASSTFPDLFPIQGSGFLHDSRHLSSDDFLQDTFPHVTNFDRIMQFVREFDQGLGYATTYSEFCDQTTPATGNFLKAQADFGNCDLVVSAWFKVSGTWMPLSLLYDPSGAGDRFWYDQNVYFTMWHIQYYASLGWMKSLFLGVPLGSGERIAVDRDRDGVWDVDEIAQSLDPVDPDFDDDGFWDGYDPNPHAAGGAAPVGAPVPLSIQVEWATSNVVKITYETSTFSPTCVKYGKAGQALTESYGDVCPPPPASNHWKRRHTALLRVLEDGSAYDFRIDTFGQNGATGSSGTMSAATESDAVGPLAGLVVREVTLAKPTTGQPDWVATVEVDDNHGQPISQAVVFGVFTTLTQGVATTQTTVVLTEDAGNPGTYRAQIAPPAGQTVGDGMSFDVPMFVVHPTTGAITLSVFLNTSSRFKWPESPDTTATETL